MWHPIVSVVESFLETLLTLNFSWDFVKLQPSQYHDNVLYSQLQHSPGQGQKDIGQ